MAWLDLDEALAEVGWGVEVSLRDVVGWRVTKAPGGKEKVAFVKGPKRSYRRHPPGTPAWKKQNLENKRARSRRWNRDNRDRIRERTKEKRMSKKVAFLKKLEKAGMIEEAKLICIGRALGEVNAIPDPALLLGPDPDHLAARIDFACFLVHPLRGWSVGTIAYLFGVKSTRVQKWLESRRVGVDGLPHP